MIVKSNFPRLFGASGLTIWPFIFIVDPTDTALVAHETVHYKEQPRYLVIFWWLLYLLSKSFRKTAEVKAYTMQISVGGLTVDQAAHYMATMYALGIDEAKAKELFKDVHA